MNCAEFDQVVHELDRREGSPGDLRDAALGDGRSQTQASGVGEAALAHAGDLSEAALAHAESCSRCAKLLTEVEALNFALHTIAQRDAHEQAPARIEASLVQAFREQAARRHVPVAGAAATRRAVGNYRWYAAALGAAAMVLLALGLVRGWMATGTRSPAHGPTGMIAQGPSETKKPLKIGNPVASPTPLQASANVSNSGTRPAQTGAAEDLTAFYALPYADDAASLDGGAVIRVSVPRSALVAWGLPVSGMGSGGPVPADLVVSADGTPQAIRLVSETNE